MAPESYIFRVVRYAFRGMGYKKGLFPIEKIACLRADTHRQATRNPEQLRDRKTNKLKKTYFD